MLCQTCQQAEAMIMNDEDKKLLLELREQITDLIATVADLALLDAIRQGQTYEYADDRGELNLLQPVHLHADIAPWAIKLSFPQRVVTADARDLLGYTLLVSVLCAVVAAVVLVAVLNHLTRPLRTLATAMAGLAGGNADLTARLEVRGKDELARIAGGFNEFVGKLQGVLARVRHISDDVAVASTEISRGNADLSARTEQQASALEETAASMEELTSTVRQNADNARQANQLAQGASQIAARGSAVVAQVVDTMGSIKASSQKIGFLVHDGAHVASAQASLPQQ